VSGGKLGFPRLLVLAICGISILMIPSFARQSQDSSKGPEPTTAQWELFFPDGDGKSYVTALCQTCHSLKNVVLQRQDASGWRGILSQMNSNGASLEQEDIDIMVPYLAKNFGPDQASIDIPMDLNTAKPEQIARLPLITAADAGKIVSAREKSPLKSVADLKKILPEEKIEKIRPFISLD
jgi:hypothetical protein